MQKRVETSATRQCVSCGRTIDWNSNVCPYCGHDYRMIQAGLAPPQKERSVLPVVGGVLIIIAGLVAIGLGAMFMTFDTHELQEIMADVEYDISLSELEDAVLACGTISIIFGLIAVVGGVFALVRKHFGLAVVGGIFAIMGLGFILGLIGLILVAVGRSSFEK